MSQSRQSKSTRIAQPRHKRKAVAKASQRRGRGHAGLRHAPVEADSAPAGDEAAYKTAANEVRRCILEGVFTADEKITHEQLHERIGGSSISKVSLTRALIDLEHEGLVRISPKAGTYVRRIEADELSQLWRTRVILEDFFVSALARDTRGDLTDEIAKARDLNHELMRLASNATQRDLDSSVVAQAMALDIAFHDQLAAAAGFPLLTKELANVRNRLRLATGPIALTVDQLRQIAADHTRILEAIRPRQASLVGDVVRARLALSSHLRNAADRQGITTSIKKAAYGTDPIWDIPVELSPPEANCSAGLSVLRILLELFVAAELSKQRLDGRLLVPTDLCAKMTILAEACSGRVGKAISPEVKAEFITYDIRFHASLAFLSGMMFADEAISHIWQRMYDTADRTLDAGRMHEVVREHNKILSALAFYSQNSEEPDATAKILHVVKSHLLNALGRAASTHAKPAIAGKDPGPSNIPSLPASALEFIEWFVKQLAGQ